MPKTILITGASSSIVENCARYAVKAGHKLALAARRIDNLSKLVDEFGADNALAIACDVTDATKVEDAVARTVARFGRIGVVFANAGLGASARGTEQGDPDSFCQMIEVNCIGVTYTAKYSLPYLKASLGILFCWDHWRRRARSGGQSIQRPRGSFEATPTILARNWAMQADASPACIRV